MKLSRPPTRPSRPRAAHNPDTIFTSVRISRDLRKRVRVAALEAELRMDEFVIGALEAKLRKAKA